LLAFAFVVGGLPYLFSIDNEKVELVFRNLKYGLFALSLTRFWNQKEKEWVEFD
jgi:hypothetical protein